MMKKKKDHIVEIGVIRSIVNIMKASTVDSQDQE